MTRGLSLLLLLIRAGARPYLSAIHDFSQPDLRSQLPCADNTVHRLHASLRTSAGQDSATLSQELLRQEVHCSAEGPKL